MTYNYPRVLIIYKNKVAEGSNSWPSVGSWFTGWPAERLAHLYTSGGKEADYFCDNEYLYGAPDRRFGVLFSSLKAAVTGDALGCASPASEGRRLSLRTQGVGLMVKSGIWELVFAPKISDNLANWLTAFRPNIIYSQVADLSMVSLTLGIQRRFDCALCVHMSDDFISSNYRVPLLGAPARLLIRRRFKTIADVADLRFATGTAMKRVYEKEYSRTFVPLYMCREMPRERPSLDAVQGSSSVLRIVYTGSLGIDRWQSIVDVAEALRGVTVNGVQVEVHVYGYDISRDAGRVLEKYDNIRVHPLPSDSDTGSVLATADILLIVEGFSKHAVRYTRLSVSTKAHLYMMAGKPIMLFAPSDIGVMEYARREGWGYLVTERSHVKIVNAVIRLVTDNALRKELTDCAWNVARRNHDAQAIRAQFRDSLISAVIQKRGVNRSKFS